MLKHPMTTNSNWLAPKWSIAQKRYVLEDVEFLSLGVRGFLLTEKKQFLHPLIYLFPERKLGESVLWSFLHRQQQAYESSGIHHHSFIFGGGTGSGGLVPSVAVTAKAGRGENRRRSKNATANIHTSG